MYWRCPNVTLSKDMTQAARHSVRGKSKDVVHDLYS
jgi:hypothetical protein